MADLYDLILKELNESKACHVDRFPPFYICSIGSHLLNLWNRKNSIYFVSRIVEDLRLHILFLAPPGGEKTFWMEQFLRGEQALLLDSGIDIGFAGTITEAGFVGTVKFDGGEKVTVPGLCMSKQNAIIGIEEFSIISVMLRTDYAKALDPAMLGALDSGWVYKQLAAGDLNYQTYLSLWTATQPARFDLRGGMGRRLLFIHFIPTTQDWIDIKLARRRAKNIRYNPIQTDVIRNRLKQLNNKLSQLQKIEWDTNVYRLYDKMKFLPYEEKLYDRLLLGYLVMRGKFDSTLYVTLDKTIEKLIVREAHYRDTIRRGSEFAEVLLILRQHNGSMELFKLKDELLAYGKDWLQSAKLIDDLVKIRAIKKTSDNIVKLSDQLRNNRRF